MGRYIAVMSDGSIVEFPTTDRGSPRNATLPDGTRFLAEQATLIIRLDEAGNIIKYRNGSDQQLWEIMSRAAAICESERIRNRREP